MATLRDNLNLRTPLVQASEYGPEQEMGDFRRGLRNSLIGTDINSALADESSLRAGGNMTEADKRRRTVDLLRQQQGIAPVRVQGVEDVNGVGDAIDFVQGGLGSAAGSMAAPIAAGVGVGALGAAVGAMPNPVAKAVGAGLRRYGTVAAPFAINQEQMKGEFYGQASADPTLMANTSAQDLNRMAEGVGVAGGALDTLLPAAFARSAVGLGMRGVQNVGLKTLGGSAMEGATEIGQGEIGRQVRGVLNPDQDTSGFALDRINEGVLGAIGGAPVSLGAAALDSTYDAGRRGVERAGDLAGTTMDLLGEKAGPAMDAAKTAAGPAMDAAKGFFNSARGKVVDLGTDDVVGKLKAAGKTVKSGWDARREEMDIISGEPPAGLDTNDPEAYRAWWDETSPKRSALIVERVQRLADEGDEQAAELLGNIAPGSDQGIEDAAKYLGENLRVNEVARAAERAGDVLGKIVRGTGRVAGEFGKATWNAAAGTKKNRQRAVSDSELWDEARRSNRPGSPILSPSTAESNMPAGEVLKSRPGTQFDVDAASNRSVLEAEYDVRAAKARSLRRAKLMGEYLSAVAEAEKPRYMATRAENVVPNFMKDVGGELSDLVESWRDARPVMRPASTNPIGAEPARPEGPTSTLRQSADSRGQQFDGLKFNLNRIATQLVGAYGDNAPKVAADLRNMVGGNKQAEAILELLEAQVAEGLTPAGRRNTEATRRAAAEEILAKLPQEAETKLLGQGINLRSDEGKRQLLGMVESIVTGRVRPEARSALSQLLGEDTLTDMAEALAVPAQDTTRETSMFSGSSSMEDSLTDSGLEMTEDGDIIDAYETKQAEKSMAKGSGTKYYGFAKMPSVANSAQARDPFGYTTKLTAAERKARLADGDKTARRRPTLLVKGKLLSSGQDEIEHRIGLVQKYLDGKGGEESLFKVTPRKVSEVMDDLGVQPAKRLTLFADYMMQEGGDLAAKPESRETGERMQEIGRTARKALLVAMEEGSGNQSRTTPGERRLVRRAMDRYFDSRYVVTGEAMTDVDPDKISMADFEELKDSGYIAYNEARGAGQNKSAVMDEDNLLTFKQDGDEVYIKAKDLAAWSQRTQRDRTKSDLAENDTRSATERDREFVADLLTGISALVATGQVDGMPTRMSAKGVAQSFGRGVPPNLLLPSGNRYAKLRSVPVETDNVPVDDTDTVAVEQDRDYYTPDESGSGETREGQSKDEFEAQRRTSRQQGFDAKNPQRLGRSTNARAAAGEAVTPGKPVVKMPLSTAPKRDNGPRADDIERGEQKPLFPGSSKVRAGMKADVVPTGDVTGTLGRNGPADLSTPKKFLTGLQQFSGVVEGLVKGTPEIVGGYAPNKTQRATLLKVRAREFEQYTEALAGLMQSSPFTPKQKETISKTMAAIGTALNAAPETAAAPAQKTASAAGMSSMELAIAQRQEFLNNPPADYTSEKGVEVGVWAKRQLVRIEADMSRYTGGASKDVLRGYKYGLERIIAKATEMVEGDASLAGFEGNASPKEGGAPLGKPVGGRKLNAQNNGGLDEQRAKLVTRLADDRRGAFAMASAAGVHEDATRVVRFGPVTDGRGFYLLDQDFAHAFVVPGRLAEAARRKLSEYPADRAADVLSIYAVQHVTYQRDDGNLTSFGPDPRAPAGRSLTDSGALGFTGKRFRNGVPVTRVEGVTDRQVLALMADTLAYTKQVLGKDSLPVRWKRQTGANEGKEGSGIFNAQTFGQPSSMEDRAKAVEYVKRVLGPKIKVQFEKNLGYSGEWVDATETIRIATTSLAGSMQVAYHEALHGFFSKFIKNDPKAFEVFKALGDNLELTQRVHALLAGHPAAQAQLVDGEERIAYMYQFWAAGMLDLPHGKPRTLFQKVKKFFRAALGMVSDTERAVDILHAFHAGEMSEPSAAGKVIAKAISQGTWTRKNMRKMDAMMQKAAALTMPAESVLKVSASETAQKIGRMFFANPGEETEGTGETGYLNAREQMSRRYTNEFSRIMAGMSDRDYAAVGKYMNEGIADPNTIASVPHREAVVKLRALLQRFREYMVDERGMKVGDLGPLYYPRVWNLDKLLGERDAFMKMMAAKYPDQNADAVYNALTENLVDDAKAGRPRDEDGVLAPMNRGGEERVFSWMDAADAAPFLEDSLVGTLTRYFHEGVRAAEYTHRFGQTGDKLETMLAKTSLELTEEGKRLVKRGELADAKAADAWHARQMRDVRESVGAMEGTLGKDISGAWRKTTSWVMVYQNIRLLPLSLFSSVVDPLGLFARGAEFKDAMEAFTRGITEVGRSWADMFRDEPKARQADKWERLAEYVGSVDAAIFDTQVADMYASTYLNPTAKAINDKFFKINGMEGWNRGMRVGATRAAVKFIERHSGLPEAHSERWMTELGLTPADVTLDKDGNLLVSVGEIVAAKGISRAQARVEANKLHTAINRWVTGAVLTPNAAQRPAWSSDPHYSMFFHLKQFTYSFHQTIIKRVYNEMQHGNLAPLGAMAWYIPVMIASDITKGVMQGGGELPAHMKAMDAGEWVLYAAERGGLAGLGQLGIDANQDLASIGGPMVEQIVDSFSDPLDRTAIKAMPANAVYANWVD